MICAIERVGFRSFSSASTSVLSVANPRQIKAKWRNHLPALSGDKMHKCQKSFGQAGHLKIQMLTHIKERTYACVQCQRSWGGTWSPTVGRKYTTVNNAESPLAELVIWRGTCSFTVGRSHTIAHNAILRLHTHMISDITSKHIPYKSQNSANGASTPQSNDQAL